MKVSDEEIRSAIIRIMEREEAKIDEEMKHAEPHVFSAEFEKKMEEVMRVQERKSKRSGIVRYVAAAAAVVLLVGGVLFVGSEDLRASALGVDILKWMENFFVVENDTNRDKDEEVGVLFEESQIGYLPEGFEKVEETVRFSKVCYKYQNESGDYIVLEVYRDKTSSGIDNEEIAQEIDLNAAGLEYRYVFKEDSNEHILTWLDKEDSCYILHGAIDKEEIIEIMDSISYWD